jgi:Zn-dependent M28 family amino/carboxypeptidase
MAKTFRLAIRPDSRPEAGNFYRSDHFSLARVGIPSFSINEGVKYKGHDALWGEQQADDFTANRYHQPSDEYHPNMDFTGDAAMARFGFALGWEAAAQNKLITWKKGDEFDPTKLKTAAGSQ